jgi:mannose-6-phosphate isomerase-like protein (cupin superfamily)
MSHWRDGNCLIGWRREFVMTIAAPLAGKILGSTDNDFVIAEWRDPGGIPGQRRLIAPLHVHYGDDEAWYVLEGSLIVQVDDEEVEAVQGCGVLVPQGTAHTYWNPTDEPVRYLLIMPRNIHHLIQAIHALPERNPAVLAAVFERHNSALLG